MTTAAGKWTAALLFVILALGVVAGVWRFLHPDEAAMIRDGRALAQVRALVDGRRACATLLQPEWPMVASEDAMRADSIDTLIAAGLVAKRPAEPRDGRRWYRLDATPSGARDMVLKKPPASLQGAIKPAPYLCYGRKQVVGLRQHPARADPADPTGAGLLPFVTYRYRIVDMPDWTRRADMRAAFPFLDQVRTGVLEAAESPSLRGRQFTLEGPIELDVATGMDAYFHVCQVRARERGGDDISPDQSCRR